MSDISKIAASGFSTPQSTPQMKLKKAFLDGLQTVNQGDTRISILGIKYDFFSLVESKINDFTTEQAQDLINVILADLS